MPIAKRLCSKLPGGMLFRSRVGLPKFRTTLSNGGGVGGGHGSGIHINALEELRQNIGKIVSVKVGLFSGQGKDACFEVYYGNTRGAFYPKERSPLRKGYNETIFDGAFIPAKVTAIMGPHQHFMFHVEIADKEPTIPGKKTADATAASGKKIYVHRPIDPKKLTTPKTPTREQKAAKKTAPPIKMSKKVRQGFETIMDLVQTSPNADPTYVHDPIASTSKHLVLYFPSPDAAEILFALRSCVRDADTVIEKIITDLSRYHDHYASELRRRYNKLARDGGNK